MDGRLIGGRYRLLEPRGMGGTAAVWRATDERTGRPVAVKLLHPHLAADPAARERLQREALSMGGIDHPNVVAVRDLILDGDRPALIMDFVEGQSLAEAIATTGARTEAEALRIASEAADGLAAVHAAGLVHRDLKPANILLGTDGRARVTDLGIAASADPGDSALTATDGVAGTLRYLAPERLLGEPAVAVTDVWGLGVVLVEMLTGDPAFPATSIQARVGAASQGVVRPAGVAAPVWAIIERATADDPTARYPTAESMATDLRRLAPVPIVTAGTGDVDQWADTAVIPLPVAAAVSTLAPAALGLAAATAPVDAPPAIAEPRERRHGVPLIAALGAAVLVLVIAVAALGGAGPDAPGRSGDPAPGPSAPAATNALVTASPSAPATDDAAPSGDDNPGKGKGRGNGKGKDD